MTRTVNKNQFCLNPAQLKVNLNLFREPYKVKASFLLIKRKGKQNLNKGKHSA